MAGISLAEIDALTTRDKKLGTATKSCPRQSEIIFCSNPNCNSIPTTDDRLTLLEQGWKIINDVWYCPQCPSEKIEEKNKLKYINLIRI